VPCVTSVVEVDANDAVQVTAEVVALGLRRVALDEHVVAAVHGVGSWRSVAGGGEEGAGDRPNPGRVWVSVLVADARQGANPADAVVLDPDFPLGAVAADIRPGSEEIG
jgi:hypothetical protein